MRLLLAAYLPHRPVCELLSQNPTIQCARRQPLLKDRKEPSLTKVGGEERYPLGLLSLVSKDISDQWAWGRPGAAYA